MYFRTESQTGIRYLSKVYNEPEKHSREIRLTIHDDEAKRVLVLKQATERLRCIGNQELMTKYPPHSSNLSMKLVVAEIQRSVDGLERLKVNVDLLLLAIFCDDLPAEHHQSVCGHCRSS